MNPPTHVCHHPQCPARGPHGPGHIRGQRRAEPRYRCPTCGQTVAATHDPPCSRVRTAADVVTIVLTWLSHGCPTQAIVAACGVDARTVAAWLTRAGQHCQRVHQHRVQQGRVDLPHVQADARWVTLVGRRVWLALALAIPSRLGLGGVISPQRDRVLITTLVPMVRSGARRLAILVGVEGLTSSVTALLHGCRQPVRTGRQGRPRLVREAGRRIGPMVTRDGRRRVVGVERRVVRGTAEAITAVLVATGGGMGINTAAIERLNATFRRAWAVLTRRGRAMAPTEAVLTAGMWLVGGT